MAQSFPVMQREGVSNKHLDLHEVLRYKRDGEYPPGVKDKSNFRRQTKNYAWDQEKRTLVYSTITNGSKVQLRVIVEKAQQLQLIRMVHDGPSSSDEAAGMSAHRGRDAVVTTLSREYHWPGLSRDVREYIRTCETCQRVNDAHFKVVPEVRPVGAPRDVMKQVGVDLIKLPESVDGMKYACVLVDYHSKWTEAEALPDKSATGVARFLHEVMCRHGCFQIQINDQGREFVNKVSKELHKLSGTKQRITSAYHPQVRCTLFFQTPRFQQIKRRPPL